MKFFLKYISILCVTISTAGLLLAGSCAKESSEPGLPELPEAPEGEFTDVDLLLTLTSGWEPEDEETRFAPPATGDYGDLAEELSGEEETKSIDKVHIVTFRRKAADPTCMSEATSDEPFYYDGSNDLLLDVEPGFTTDGISHEGETPGHRIARGKIRKIYGYEYRVVALAFDSRAASVFSGAESLDASLKNLIGDDNRMNLHLDKGDALTYDEFCADIYTEYLRGGLTTNKWGRFYHILNAGDNEILSDYASQIPQIFYGECAGVTPAGEEKDIIRFAELDANGNFEKKLPLRGVLKRGMAKVELEITPTYQIYLSKSYGIVFIALMANNVYSSVGLTHYDDFLNPYNPLNANEEVDKQKYTVISYQSITQTYSSTDPARKPVKLVAYMLPCKTRMAVRIRSILNGELHDAALKAGDAEGNGENGTGIISPDSHDGWFYLRRNHKYIIRVSDSNALMTNSDYKL